MNAKAQLAAEIDAFAAIIDRLREVAGRTDPSRLSELVALRRRLSNQIARVRAAGVPAFSDVSDPKLANEFRSRLSKVLNTVAMHQANWPAVAIVQGDATYRGSAIAAAKSNRAFIDWTRAALARLD